MLRKHEISFKDKEHKRSVIETEVENFLIFYVLRHHGANARYSPENIYFNSRTPLRHQQKTSFSLRQKINEPRLFFLHFGENVFQNSFVPVFIFSETRLKSFEWKEIKIKQLFIFHVFNFNWIRKFREQSVVIFLQGKKISGLNRYPSSLLLKRKQKIVKNCATQKRWHAMVILMTCRVLTQLFSNHHQIFPAINISWNVVPVLTLLIKACDLTGNYPEWSSE